ncbi:hypothetical protein NDI56_04070 [Haloarcula sp. S1CR25-12]|uniref:Uncharacterized protein n=1 Tax=Haloarcula saliterrae TaxID=2950534 RepID=A0ABU2F8J2_9EURY|nr:hypothetical protein [Haloarcula sp. S1CR25-12]MDS0258587.1 hypothetical protein [Haloarcula sp. S1CR25-12]
MAETTQEEADDEAQIFEIEVEQVTSETITVQANSREEAFGALEHPTDRDVQSMLVRKEFSSLSERRPVDGRHAPELEDYDDPDLDIDLTDE